MASFTLCSIDGCGKPVKARGWCGSHYGNWTRHGDPTVSVRAKTEKGGICEVDGCGKPVRSRTFCLAHYQRFLKLGNATAGRTMNGKAEVYMFAHMFDDCPKWPYGTSAQGRGYVTFEGKRRLVHQVVCELVNGPKPSEQHIAAHECGMGHEGCFGASCLSWKTISQNSVDMHRHGTIRRGELAWCAKLTQDDVKAIRLLGGRISNAELAKQFKVSKVTISNILTRRSWAWL